VPDPDQLMASVPRALLEHGLAPKSG
jgi:hypothetical protein